MGMKPIKIECPTCGQHIEIAAQRRSLIPFILGGIFILLLAWLGLAVFSARHESHEIASAAQSTRSAPSKPPPPDVPAPQTNAVAPKSNFQPITGAFGWTLGDKAPTTLGLKRTSDGALMASQRTSEYPPFKDIVLCALDDGTIYQIFATTSGDGMITDYLEIEKTLKLRYGNPQFPSGGGEQFGSGTNRIQLTRTDYSATVYYVSEPLATIAQAEQKARDIKKASQNASGL